MPSSVLLSLNRQGTNVKSNGKIGPKLTLSTEQAHYTWVIIPVLLDLVRCICLNENVYSKEKKIYWPISGTFKINFI